MHFQHSGVFSQYVKFEGRDEVCSIQSLRSQISAFTAIHEPHLFGRTDPTHRRYEFSALTAVRWSEYRVEGYLQSLARTMESTKSVYAIIPFAYSRVARARVEIKVYSEVLKAARPGLLKGMRCFTRLSVYALEFDEIL